jgi:tetratricopeptide (TPR) repeat protein
MARAREWWRAALVAACVGGGVVAASMPARAAGGDESLAAGLQKFDQGRRAYEAGQFEQALLAFQGSYELFASPNTRYCVGRCYRALGKVASAYTAFKLAAREAQDRLAASGEKRYMATRDAAAHEAADIDAKVPRLTIAVPSGTPAGFVVKLNGREVVRPA